MARIIQCPSLREIDAMTNEQVERLAKVTRINARIVVAQAEIAGMVAENMQRQQLGHSMAYTEDDFLIAIGKHHINDREVANYLRLTP